MGREISGVSRKENGSWYAAAKPKAGGRWFTKTVPTYEEAVWWKNFFYSDEFAEMRPVSALVWDVGQYGFYACAPNAHGMRREVFPTLEEATAWLRSKNALLKEGFEPYERKVAQTVRCKECNGVYKVKYESGKPLKYSCGCGRHIS